MKENAGTFEMKKKDLDKMSSSLDVLEKNMDKLQSEINVLEELRLEADEYVQALKRVHDLLIYSGIDIDIDHSIKSDLYRLKLLWEELEKLK